jgi:hypothetical protein
MPDEVRVRVRVSGPQFRHDYEWYEQGEELEVSEEILEQYPRRLERVEAEDVDDSDSDVEEEPEVADPPIDPAEYTIDELQAGLAGSDYSNAELVALRSAEQDGKDRTGAKDTIDDHLEG